MQRIKTLAEDYPIFQESGFEMYWLVFSLLICGGLAIEYTRPKLVNERILMQDTDMGAMVSKTRQCMNAQWNFTIPDSVKYNDFNRVLKRFCDRIPLIEEFRKEFEGPRNNRVYDFSDETLSITCPFSADMPLEKFYEELENMFYLNKIFMDHGATPQHLLNAAGFTGGWDMEKMFVQKSMRVRALYCDENGLMMEICVPSIHDRIYGDVEQIIDVGKFNMEKKEFSFVTVPLHGINLKREGRIALINEGDCIAPFDLGLVCPAESVDRCNMMTFEDCVVETLPITSNFTFVREFSTFFVVATVEKEMTITPKTGDIKILPIPSNIFLLVIGDGDMVMIGDHEYSSIKGTHFSNTTFINIKDLAEPKPTETYQKKNFLQKMFNFFGKK